MNEAKRPQGVPFCRPDITDVEIDAVVETLRSGWITTGPKVKEFELAFAQAMGAPWAVAVSSCTAALHVSLAATGCGPGSEVVTSVNTFTATAASIVQTGATPVLADIDEETFNLTPEAVQRAVSPRTRAIVPVHLAGQPCELTPMLETAKKHGAAVIEDAAHALPASYRGRKIGTISDLTCFSFYATKNLTTGEGGMITGLDPALKDRVGLIGYHGMSRDGWKRYLEKGSWYYEIVEHGFKYNLTDIAAVMGLAQLARLEAMQARRARIVLGDDRRGGRARHRGGARGRPGEPSLTPVSPAACRIVFVGAVEEGRRCLEAMLEDGERFAGIVTLKEEWARETSGAVPFDDLAARHGVPLLKVRDMNHPANVERIRSLAPDLILVIGWTRLVGAEILAVPGMGAIGFHASLLPKYRGRAPVNWAIIHGEKETGNTMFYLDGGVDTGDIIAQRPLSIGPRDTCATLYARVADAAHEMLRENLPLLKAGKAPRRAQDHSLATVMPKRTPEQGIIDWSLDADALDRWVRALTHPYPGAFTHIGNERLFVWQASAVTEPGPPAPGRIRAIQPGGVIVGAGAGALALERVQLPGEDEDSAAAIALRRGWRAGTTCGAGAPAAAPGGRS
ncbi:MAG: DegT/DnrJ/EryC1/StrS family aminotransferase [Acidobacteria bacterium]|nr:DegT/DnrJ/EryC1/StrS family aminotransferase [Acidobacteriota bacterium]